MSPSVLLDQYSLSELGSDRGLGRYATTIAIAASELEEILVENLLRDDSPFKGPEVLRIQRDIKKLNLHSLVPYHSTSVYHLPVRKDRPWICSIQDVIPLDLKDYRKLGIKSRLLFANAKRADLILANSQYTKNRIVAKMRVPSSRIMTCALPISESFTASSSESSVAEVSEALVASGIDPSRPFVVALADLRTSDPRKRYHWIDEVAAELQDYGIPMVVTGRGISQGHFPHSHIVQAFSDTNLSTLYSMAVASYYPSAYEGQGLPPQEAMASGCPVVAYRNTSVEEVVESSEFLLDDPVPWEQQRLSAALPQTARAEAASRIAKWAESQELSTEAQKIAVQTASKYSWKSFSANLKNFYDGYFEGCMQ